MAWLSLWLPLGGPALLCDCKKLMLFKKIVESFDPRLKTKLVIIKLIMLNVLEKNSLEIGFCVLGMNGTAVLAAARGERN